MRANSSSRSSLVNLQSKALATALLRCSKPASQASRDGVEVEEIVGGNDFSLDHGEVDLCLVEPGSVLGQVDEAEVVPLTLQAPDRRLAPMRAAVVDHPEHPLGARVRPGCHHLVDQAAEGAIPVVSSQRPKTCARCTS